MWNFISDLMNIQDDQISLFLDYVQFNKFSMQFRWRSVENICNSQISKYFAHKRSGMTDDANFIYATYFSINLMHTNWFVSFNSLYEWTMSNFHLLQIAHRHTLQPIVYDNIEWNEHYSKKTAQKTVSSFYKKKHSFSRPRKHTRSYGIVQCSFNAIESGSAQGARDVLHAHMHMGVSTFTHITFGWWWARLTMNLVIIGLLGYMLKSAFEQAPAY